MTTHAHFVGSIGLDTAEQVFATVGRTVGAHIKRCPDGEVGGRRMWIGWQYPVLRGNTALEVVGNQAIGGSGLCPIRVKPGTKEADIHFGELGYAREARASYLDFIDAREKGLLPQSVRFQVSLPTPLAVIRSFIVADDAARVLPAYQDAMVREAQRICEAIPHDDLAIQWDVCIEMILWDGRSAIFAPLANMKDAFEKQFAALGKAVAPDVQMGVHLCYGDLDAKHFIEPLDLAKAVELANLIIASIGRPLTWLHVPVPVERDDVVYFAPLGALKKSADTELYLGLVHVKDGQEGTLRRMHAARKIVTGFGIATECGISRARTPELARQILQAHVDAISAWDR
jgi:methionine synthase II (cobalamin-independent)